MKLIAAIILCLFFGTAFSQDSTSVEPLPIIDLDTAALDTTILDTAALDTTIIDTTAVDTTVIDSNFTKIKSGLHFFASVGAQFIDFNERSKFQALLNTQDTTAIKQNFQKVNLTFPITAGIIWQISDMHSLGLGVGFLYSKESVILTDTTDSKEETHNFEYTLQALPIFAEYRLQISPNFLSLSDGDYFSIFARYYWMLPYTEISSSWGNAKADFDPLGNGFGIFFGYRFWEWKGLSIWGEMGYLSIEVKSSDKNGILDSWNLGGISLLIRAMF